MQVKSEKSVKKLKTDGFFHKKALTTKKSVVSLHQKKEVK